MKYIYLLFVIVFVASCQSTDQVGQGFLYSGTPELYASQSPTPSPTPGITPGGTPAVCDETDDRIDLDNYGVATDNDGSIPDRCVYVDGVHSLRESYCNEENMVDTVTVQCPEGTACVEGECSSQWCIDGDSGLNEFTSSDAKDSSGNHHIDSCYSETKVHESVCNNGVALKEIVSCSDEEVCYEGRCISRWCADQDDHIDETVATGAYNERGQFVEDTCGGFDGVKYTTVLEAFCSNNEIKTVHVGCPSGTVCAAGVCVDPKDVLCHDYDEDATNNGINIPVASGVLAHNGKFFADECIGRTRLNEYYCHQREADGEWLAVWENVNCVDTETGCVDGRCGCLVDADCPQERWCIENYEGKPNDAIGGFVCKDNACQRVVKSVCSYNGRCQYDNGEPYCS